MKTKEYLLDKGFVSVGSLNGCEYLAKKLEDGGFAYFAVAPNGNVLHEYAQTISLEHFDALCMIKEKLFS